MTQCWAMSQVCQQRHVKNKDNFLAWVHIWTWTCMNLSNTYRLWWGGAAALLDSVMSKLSSESLCRKHACTSDVYDLNGYSYISNSCDTMNHQPFLSYRNCSGLLWLYKEWHTSWRSLGAIRLQINTCSQGSNLEGSAYRYHRTNRGIQ